uniref:Uncharacterized protein n=1 Tax=Arundo donax TaxID=35708 RepID=A0A0A8XUT8_ARUDO
MLAPQQHGRTRWLPSLPSRATTGQATTPSGTCAAQLAVE